MTATSLGRGLTEVLMFGGRMKWGPALNAIAETTVLRFGMELGDCPTKSIFIRSTLT